MKTPAYVLFASGGNDSVALVQLAHEDGLKDVVVAYSNTGWAASWWPLRMAKFQAWVERLGFTFAEIPSMGMEALIRKRSGWPANGMQFCTTELKIKPAQAWLDSIDPYKEAICMLGIRRCESKRRRNWPMVIDKSENHGDRELYSPMVEYEDADRDELVIRAGWEVLPHRSKECSPCVNMNRADFRKLEEPEITRVITNEYETGRNMFRPHRFKGARGLAEVMKWAWSERGKYEPPDTEEASGCDSGMCGN